MQYVYDDSMDMHSQHMTAAHKAELKYEVIGGNAEATSEEPQSITLDK